MSKVFHASSSYYVAPVADAVGQIEMAVAGDLRLVSMLLADTTALDIADSGQ